jgi:RNA polymerase sigma-70 factor (ECF subfamily)
MWDTINLLVERARAGDRQAYGELVERFQPAVYALALSRLGGNHDEAMELTQEVWMHVMSRLPTLNQAAAFLVWLRVLTIRKAVNRLTRKAPLFGIQQETLNNTPARNHRTALDELIRAEEKTALRTGLNCLSGRDRDLLMSYYFRGGRSLKELSREFGVPVGTIKRRLHVARKRLRAHLERGR